MVTLLDLPDEILMNICDFIETPSIDAIQRLSRVNRRLRSIALPVVARFFPRDNNRQIQPFAMLLLRNPHLRDAVQELILPLSSLDDLESLWDHDEDEDYLGIRPSELEELATAAAQAWPEMAESTEWLEDIRNG